MNKFAPKELEPGTALYSPQRDCFEVVRFLGKGSFGEVYAARQLIYGRPFRTVALKLFLGDFVTAANIGETFSDAITLVGMQEECPSAEVARHIVAIFDMGLLAPRDAQRDRQGDLQNRAFVSMKLIPGGMNLLKLLNRFPEGMPVALTLRYLRQMLIPLAWMHSLSTPIVHGDLKPDNVLVTEDFEIVVTDFGLAARMPLGSHGGAMAYQAPELLLANLVRSTTSQAFGVAMDVYAVGIMWYEMLTRQHPFSDVGTQTQTGGDDCALKAHLEARKRPIPPASKINEEFGQHPQLNELLTCCLEERPSDRVLNAAKLLESVDSYIESGKVDTSVIRVAADRPRPEQASNPSRTDDAIVSDAEALTRTGRPEEALRVLAPLIQKNPRHTPAMLAQVRALVASKSPKDAWVLCGGLAETAEVLDVQAEVLKALGKPSQADSARLRAQKLRDGTRR